MSKRNVELLHRLVEAFNERDVETFITYCDPDIEFHSAFAAVGGAVYHGHDGMRMWQQDFEDVWGDEVRVETEAYFDLGEHALAFQVMHGRGLHSGVEVAMPITLVTRWRKDLMVHFKAYVHREDALSAVGVSEDELEPTAP